MFVDWSALLLGFFVGLPASILFFAGLAWGMRLALRSDRPGGLLLLSALCRIGMLLGIGFWLAAASSNAWPLAGYALAFFLVRIVIILRARLASTSAPTASQQPTLFEQRDV